MYGRSRVRRAGERIWKSCGVYEIETKTVSEEFRVATMSEIAHLSQLMSANYRFAIEFRCFQK